MGWGWLGKLGKIAAGIAAPFTGGASLLAIPAIGAAEGAASGGGWTGALTGALGGVPSMFGAGGIGSGGGGLGDTMGADPSWIMSAADTAKSPSIWQRIGGVLTGQGTAGKIAGTAGDIATGIEKGRSEDRANENEFNLAQDNTRLRASQGYEDDQQARAELELKQKGFEQGYQNNAYRNAILSALGMNMQDVTLGGVGKDVPVVSFNGGLRPSALGPQGREAAALLNSKAMDQLRNGTAFTPLPALERFTPSDRKTGNWMDTVLGGIGIAGKAGDIWNERSNNEKDRGWIEKIREELEQQQKPKTAQPQPPFLPGTEMTDENGKVVVPDMPPTPPTPVGTDPLQWLNIMQGRG